MEWKQPIPTRVEGLNPEELAVFQRILLRCRNEEGDVLVNNTYIHLKRGECIIGRFEFAREFLLKRKESMRVQRIIDRIVKVSNLMSKRKSKDCTVITVYNYDSFVQFEQSNELSVSNHRAISEQSVSTNKNDKNEKSVENEEIVHMNPRASLFLEHIKKKPLILPEEQIFPDDIAEMDYEDSLESVVDCYNSAFGKSVVSIEGFQKNFEFWKVIHPIEQMKAAILVASRDPFWKSRMTLTILFRRKNPRGESVDYIGDLSTATKLNSPLAVI